MTKLLIIVILAFVPLVLIFWMLHDAQRRWPRMCEAYVYEKFGKACRTVPYKVNEQDVLDALQSVANKFGVEVSPNWQQTMLDEHRRIQRTRVSYVQQKRRSKKYRVVRP